MADLRDLTPDEMAIVSATLGKDMWHADYGVEFDGAVQVLRNVHGAPLWCVRWAPREFERIRTASVPRCALAPTGPGSILGATQNAVLRLAWLRAVNITFSDPATHIRRQ